MTTPERYPLRQAATRLTKVLGGLGALVTGLVGWGVLSAVQGDALVALLGAIPAVVTLVTTLLVAFGVVRAGEPQVTPMVDPRDDTGRPLYPA